jgi:hypothetical protein
MHPHIFKQAEPAMVDQPAMNGRFVRALSETAASTALTIIYIAHEYSTAQSYLQCLRGLHPVS